MWRANLRYDPHGRFALDPHSQPVLNLDDDRSLPNLTVDTYREITVALIDPVLTQVAILSVNDRWRKKRK
jgi:hypothetical protein